MNTHIHLTQLKHWLLIGLCTLTLAACAGQVKEVATKDLPEALQNRTVSIEQADITFASSWLREQRRSNTQGDIDTLHARYVDFMTRSLETTLTRQGWTVTANAPVAVQLSLNNMRITAPDFRGALSELYAREDFGSADFSIRFSQDGNTIAEHAETSVDTRGGIPGQMTKTNRGLNQRAFEQTLQRVVSRMEPSLIQ